ncbi:glycosyltransferase family 2 protein, partial [Streptomyces exfoliatus]
MSSNAPDVSVVIGAYQAMPYLIRCLESVEAQTLGAGRLEIIAVDDGSTDGTGEYLDAFAARTAIDTRVVHQENSGGPSGPRNTGLGLARGRYVFFLDADDYFGEEALERMVAMGDRAGTDVVLGKVVGVNRGAAKSMWKQTVERADIYFS